MDKLSTRLANCSIEDARPLLIHLLMTVHPEIKHISGDGYNCPNDDLWDNTAEPFFALLDIGPEGYLSAVAMLVPEGWNYTVDTSNNEALCFTLCKRGYYSAEHWAKAQHPALAFASAIAMTLEANGA